MKKAIFVGMLAVLVFYFVGIISFDNEFYESADWFIKKTPGSQFIFTPPPLDWDEIIAAEQREHVLQFNKRTETYQSMGLSGRIIAFTMVELLLIAIIIKPVFCRMFKFIARDICFIIAASLITYICFELWVWNGGLYSNPGVAAFYIAITLLLHFIVFRLLRPVK